MIIRRAVENDLLPMIDMGERMHAAGRYSWLPYDKEKLAKLAMFLHKSQFGLLLVAQADDGRMVGMMVASVETYFFCDERITNDFLLWVEPTDRGAHAGAMMIRHFEDWGKTQGVCEFQLCATNEHGDVAQARIGKLYEKLGYERVGYIYKRRA